MSTVPVVAFIGRSGSGKTTLMEGVVRDVGVPVFAFDDVAGVVEFVASL